MTITGERALDHFVIAVRDLDRAGDAWAALGFRVLPKMRHVTAGCANRVVQFGRTYVELLGDIELMIEMYRGHYLGRFAHGEGLANICFTSNDLESDRAGIEGASISCSPVTSARRPVVMPNGAVEDTDSDFFYPWRAGHAYMSPFLAAHRKPQIIFVPEYAVHPNTAENVVTITCHSPNPAEDAAFFALMAAGTAETIDGGMRVRLAKGDTVEILTTAALVRRYEGALPPLASDSPGFGVGLTVRVASLEKCRSAIAVDVLEADGTIMVPASRACGAFVRFVGA